MLSLGAYGALALGWVYLGSVSGKIATPTASTERTLDIALEPTVQGRLFPKVLDAPSGGGRGGTGTVDPNHLLAEPEVPVPKTASTDISEFLLIASPSLPLAPGGDGLSKGQGPGSGGGTGGGTGTGSGIRPPPEQHLDEQLVATKKVELQYKLAPGQAQGPCTVVVSVRIEDDGRVSHAQAISGPAYLFPAAEAAARQWTFEPLARHGLRGPCRLKLNFFYRP